MKDYLHADKLLRQTCNNRVFHETYSTIEKIAKKITAIESTAFGVRDPETIQALEKINEQFVSDQIIDLVNFTIRHFNKYEKTNG